MCALGTFSIMSYTLLLSLIEYKTLILREDYERAEEVLPTIPKEHMNRYDLFLLGSCNLHFLSSDLGCLIRVIIFLAMWTSTTSNLEFFWRFRRFFSRQKKVCDAFRGRCIRRHRILCSLTISLACSLCLSKQIVSHLVLPGLYETGLFRVTTITVFEFCLSGTCRMRRFFFSINIWSWNLSCTRVGCQPNSIVRLKTVI
jgi:hypothetical protein